MAKTKNKAVSDNNPDTAITNEASVAESVVNHIGNDSTGLQDLNVTTENLPNGGNSQPLASATVGDSAQTETNIGTVNPDDGSGYFEYRGKKYGLSKACPEKLQYEDTLYTKEELITNESAMADLIECESPFVKIIL